MDLLKEAQAILNEDKDSKGYKVLFILEPTLTLHDDYYESEYMEEYSNHEPVCFAARSSDEITSISIAERRMDYIAPWAFTLGDDVMKLLEMQYEIKAMTPEGHYSLWRYIAGKNDLHSVAGVKAYMVYCQEHGITKDWLQNKLPYIKIPDIYDSNTWKPYVKNSRYYLDHSCLEGGENYVPICILDKFYPENTDVFAVATNGKELVTFHPKDFSMSREHAIQPADSQFHEIFIDKLKNGFRIDHMELLAHVMLWNSLPKYFPKATDGINVYLIYCKVNGITADKIRESTHMHVPDIMNFYNKPKHKTQER